MFQEQNNIFSKSFTSIPKRPSFPIFKFEQGKNEWLNY